MTALWTDPCKRGIFVDKAKQRWASPEKRQQLSDVAKQRWKDLSYRDKQHLTRNNKPPKSGHYKGVSFDTKAKRWRVCICTGGKKIHLGSFLTVVEAARRYNEAVDTYRGGIGYKNPV